MSFSTSVLQRCRQVFSECSSSSLTLCGAGSGEQSTGGRHCVKGLCIGVRWQLDTRPSEESASSGLLTRAEQQSRELTMRELAELLFYTFTDAVGKIRDLDFRRTSNLLSMFTSLSLSGWLHGVGDDELGLRSSAGETLLGLVVANSSTNCNMSARGYLAGPEP